MRRSGNRIGTWEIRVFNDLKAFCSADDDFIYIRRAITALVDAKPLDVNVNGKNNNGSGSGDGDYCRCQ